MNTPALEGGSPPLSDEQLAEYIIAFMRRRNGGELNEAISGISWASYERMVGELTMILQHRGRPPNWIGP